MRFLFWDIETAPQEGFYWRGNQDYIPHINQEQPTTILMFSWKYSDEDKIHNIKVSPKAIRDDYKVVKKANKLLNHAADNGVIVVHQNGNSFDYKHVRARNTIHRLPPIPKIKKDFLVVDTLLAARKAGYDYKRLDYLDKILHGPDAGKVETTGQLLWNDICSRHSSLALRRESLQIMREYCDGDIICLERVFNTLNDQGEIDLPNRLLHNGQVDGCPSCGSKCYVKRGIRYTATRAYQSYKCNDCGKRFQDTRSMRGSSFKAA